MGRVNELRVDSAIARLRRIAPTIKLHGTEYERGKFCEKLSQGFRNLEHTAAWLRGALLRLSRQCRLCTPSSLRGYCGVAPQPCLLRTRRQ